MLLDASINIVCADQLLTIIALYIKFVCKGVKYLLRYIISF